MRLKKENTVECRIRGHLSSCSVCFGPVSVDAAGYQPEAGGGALYPNEVSSDFAFIPFGGGARKCVGDQFALFEATVAFAMLLRRFTFRLAVPVEQVGMATGATIHTANGMMMKVTPRQQQQQQLGQQRQEQPTAAAV